MKHIKNQLKNLAIIILMLHCSEVAKSQVCKPTFIASGQSYGMYTSNVTLDSINNSSTMPANSPYYTYYNNMSTTVKTGFGYWVKVTSGPNTFGLGNIAAWLDFNGNDTFESSEKLGEIQDINSGAQDSIYFNVPSNDDSGQTKMRIIYSYYYTNIGPCDNLYYGDCEDYLINIQYVACTAPPAAGSVISNNYYVCSSNQFILSLQGATMGAKQTYQWQKSSDNAQWTNMNGAVKSIIKFSQTDSTYYRCKVTCGSYTDSTAGVLIAQKPATNCYCNARSSYPGYGNIANVTFGKFSYGSDTLPVIYNPHCNSGYADNTDVGYVPLIRGNSYPFSVTQISSSYFYGCDITAWIDYNQDGEFTNGEVIFNGTTTGNLHGNTVRKNITIPASVKTGVTGLRVKLVSFSSSGPCDTAYYGETEDYDVYIYDQRKFDAYVYRLENPLVKSCYTSSEPAKAAIYNAGTDTIFFANNNMQVHLDMSNLNSASLDTVIKKGYLAPDGSMSVKLNGTLDMSNNGGSYNMKLYTNLTGDSVPFNDKLYTQYTPDVPVKTGYIMDFENYAGIPINYLGDGFMYNFQTGINGGNSLRTSMLYTNKNSSTSELIGPLTNLSALKLFYKTTATMPKGDTVYIKISTDCGVNYQTIYKILPSNSSAIYYNSFQYDLSKYAGNNLIVKIMTSPHSTTNYDIDFDNFAVADKPQIKLGNDTAVCDRITINGNPNRQNWEMAWNKYKATADTLLIKATGNYICVATDSVYGISNADTIRVDVYPTPNVTLGPDQILCLGNTSILNPGNFSNGYKFNWSTGDTTATLTISKAGNYMVTVIAPPGCSGADTIIIASANKPKGVTMIKGTPFEGTYNSGTIANPDDACAGNTLTYEVTPPTGYTNAQYSSNWFITPQVISVNGTKPTGKYTLTLPTSTTNASLSFMPDVADADSTYIISYVVLDANSTCDITVSRYLKVNPPPVVNLGSDQQVCPGDAVYFNTGGNYPKYLWSNGNTSGMIMVSTPGSYWLKVTDNKGCSNSDTAELQNFVPPKVNLGNDRGACFGNAFVLDAGNQSGYLWSNGATSQSIKVIKTGTYWAKVYSNDGCIATDTIQIEILPKLNASFTYIKTTANNLKFTPDSSNYISYLWSFGDNNNSTNTTPVYIYGNDGSYNVKLVVTAKYGCTDSTTQTIKVNTGINGVENLAQHISVFPNPYNHEANLNFTLNKNSKVLIELLDIYGRKISTITNAQMTEGKHSMMIATNNTAQAVYMLRMLVDGQSTVIRLVDLGNE